MATHDDSYTSYGRPSQGSLLLWNGNAGWVKIWRQRISFNVAGGCCCRCNSIEPNGSTRQIPYSRKRIRWRFGRPNDSRRRTCPCYGRYGCRRYGCSNGQSWLKPKRWSRWCRGTRSPHRCLARGRASTNCTASNRKCDHDGSCLCRMETITRSIPCGLYWRRSIILRRILGSHQSCRSTRVANLLHSPKQSDCPRHASCSSVWC